MLHRWLQPRCYGWCKLARTRNNSSINFCRNIWCMSTEILIEFAHPQMVAAVCIVMLDLSIVQLRIHTCANSMLELFPMKSTICFHLYICRSLRFEQYQTRPEKEDWDCNMLFGDFLSTVREYRKVKNFNILAVLIMISL